VPRGRDGQDGAIDSLPTPETTMLQRLTERAISLGLATLLTLAVMATLDHLAQPDEPAAQWAQTPAPRA
jgi:hypothetical protein